MEAKKIDLTAKACAKEPGDRQPPVPQYRWNGSLHWIYFPETSDGELPLGHSDARVSQDMDALHECGLTGPEDTRLLQGGSRASMEPGLLWQIRRHA